MNYFYSTRLDKKRNVLLTSYNSKKDVEKWGEDGKVEHTIYRLELESGKIDAGPDCEGLLLRSIVVNKGEIQELITEDKFSLYVKKNGCWEHSGQSFTSYGNANTAMKNAALGYESVAVIENTENSGTNAYSDNSAISVLG